MIILGFLSPESSARRPVLSEYNLEFGGVRAGSDYLSPLTYGGWGASLSGRWTKVFNHWDDKAMMEFDADVSLQRLLNPAGTALMYGADGTFDWGLSGIFRPAPAWRLTAGATAGLSGGALYLTRNGNNPVTVLASTALSLVASADYSFRIGRLPITLSDRLSIPSLSVFFCPEYGESYYEIYLGNHSGLIHCGWWGNAFALSNRLQARMHFGKRSLVVGWHFSHRSFHANSLTTFITKYMFTVGLDF